MTNTLINETSYMILGKMVGASLALFIVENMFKITKAVVPHNQGSVYLQMLLSIF